MNRDSLVVSFALVAGLTVAFSAQAPLSNGTVNEKTIQSIRIKVTGCVAYGSEAGRYRLTGAFLSGDGKDVSLEDPLSFDLIGGELEELVGQKAEVIGITSDAKLNNSESFSSAIGSSAHDKATLTVTTVKMIGPTCP